MNQSLLDHLRPVLRRMRYQLVLRAASIGLWTGSILAICVASARWLGYQVTPIWPELLLPVGCASVGACIGARQHLSFRLAARQIDQQFRLKDRTLTAWSFSQLPKHRTGVIQRLQISDALGRLANCNLARVAPWHTPRLFWRAAAVWSLAILVGTVPTARQTAVAERQRHAQSQIDLLRQRTADELERSLMVEIQELADQTLGDEHQQTLQQLADEVRQQLDRLRQPGQGRRETLATLSEVQADIAAAQAQLNVPQVSEDLQSLGNALAHATSLETLPDLLDAQDFEQAGQLLEQWDPSQLSEVESSTLATALKPEIERMRDSSADQLADAASQLKQGIEQQDAVQSQQASQALAMQLMQQAQQIDLHRRLQDRLAQVGEAKGLSRDGGNNTAPSNESRDTWGSGRAGDPLSGKPAEISTERQRERLAGSAGDGPSRRETKSSDQLTGQVTREFRNAEPARTDRIEAALQREALPLGHRQLVRRYFQTIRQSPSESPPP